ncbi:GTP-binding protein EngB [hydrothermal vent metagenome]|uniref:GTP-binding protein EngB n=1 Tax=hydrothermal vent metagenome TaxID=652676 RepID=A0A3B0T6F3_9ZZZZ
MTDAEENNADEARQAGAQYFLKPSDFVLTVTKLADLPSARAVEVAFAGRSNVGKSSLLNALVGRRNLARTSNTPGRTQALNFFSVGTHLSLVDMPGYGYARVSKSQVAAWTALVFDYLAGRAGLRRTFLLIDARHGIKANDREVMDILDEAAVSFQVVLTKADKVSAEALKSLMTRTAADLASRPAAHPQILATSSRQGSGLDELRAAIAGFLPPDQRGVRL